jgi:exopolysaccharide production protein ExoQ
MMSTQTISTWPARRTIVPRFAFTMDFWKERAATPFVVFFFTVYNVVIIPVAPTIIAAFAACCLLYYRELYHFVLNNVIVVFFLLIVLLSAAWSIVPDLSLWYGCQLVVTALTAILMGVSATPRQIVRGNFIAMVIIIVASIISRRHGASAVGPVLIGITGSKTVIGMCAAMMLGSGMAVLFDRQQPFVLRLSTLAFIPLGGYYATHVEAATSKVSVLVFPIAFLGLLSLRYLHPRHRWVMMGLFLVLAAPLSLVVVSSDLSRNADQKILHVLHKDATLTGRTLMWKKADEWITQSPVLGYGYRAFWSSGSSDSLALLHANRVADPRAFQLHNTIKEIRVDEGLVGLVAFLAIAAFFLYKILAFVFLYPSPASAYLAASYLQLLALASISTLVGVFTTSTASFYAYGTAAVVYFMNRSCHAKTSANTIIEQSTRSVSIWRQRTFEQQNSTSPSTLT